MNNFSHSEQPEPMAEINMIPMIDIMLVLLVIFMITAPLLTHAVKVQLPSASSQVDRVEPRHITLTLDAEGHHFLDGTELGRDALEQQLGDLARAEIPPEVQLHVDRQVPYSEVADLLSLLSRQGLQKIAFVTRPAEP